MPNRFAFAIAVPLLVAALPALAADQQPAPKLDEFEQSIVAKWQVVQEAQKTLADQMQKTLLDRIGATLGQVLDERRAMKAQLADALQRCGDRCAPAPAAAPQAQAAPQAAPQAQPQPQP